MTLEQGEIYLYSNGPLLFYFKVDGIDVNARIYVGDELHLSKSNYELFQNASLVSIHPKSSQASESIKAAPKLGYKIMKINGV